MSPAAWVCANSASVYGTLFFYSCFNGKHMTYRRLLLTAGLSHGCGAPQDGVLQLLSLIFRIYVSSRGNPTVQNTAAATVRQVRLH